MATVESVLMALLVLDAIALTVLILLQQGKGADVGAAFGSGASNTMFGSVGAASFFTKATAWLAILFFVITFALAYVAKQKAETAGSIGIPTVNNVQELTEDTDAVNSTAPAAVEEREGDVPVLDDAVEALDDDVPGDVPEI